MRVASRDAAIPQPFPGRGAHLAAGPSLERAFPAVITTMTGSDFRSAHHPFTGPPLIGGAGYRAPRDGMPAAVVFPGRDGSLLFRDEPCARSVPSTPAGSSALRLQDLHAFHGLRPRGRGSAPAWSAPRARVLNDAGRLPRRTDRALARPAVRDFVVALRRLGLPFRRPPATGLLGHYPDRTLTGRFIAASQDTPPPK